MPISKPIDLEEIRKTINISSSKNNNLLIFFTIFMLYILISVLGTSDLMLLLPKNTFKMPIINFELDLISFYILAPVMLLLLHFNNLFNYNMYLKKIDKHSKQIHMETLDPSIYGYAYSLANHGFGGLLINLFLWLWIYFIPLSILMLIFIRFADYHHDWITSFHLGILVIDITFIFLSFYYNKIHVKNEQKSIQRISRWFPRLSWMFHGLFWCIIFGMGVLSFLYYSMFFRPVMDETLDIRIKIKSDNHNYLGWILTNIPYLHLRDDNNISIDCFPRLVVNEAEMAKISPSALYIPRYLAMDGTKKDDFDKEKKLILNFGTRIDLTNRNLRYADLKKCILTRADMQGSDLQAVNFMGSHMQAADFRNAKLQDAILIETKLQSSWLNNAQLQGASFAGANMQAVELGNSNLTNANLQKVQLQHAKFGGAKLGNADFRGAELRSADFRGANLTGTSFHDANITSANFNKANLTAADLSGVHFVKVFFMEAWTSPSFRGANMFSVNIFKNKLQDINLTDCQKQFIIDDNISKDILTFDGRRVKYLDTAIRQINAQKLKVNCESQETKEKLIGQLENLFNASCIHLKTEGSKYRGKKEIENIYQELITICNH